MSVSVPSSLVGIFSSFTSLWSFIRQWVVNHHIPFVFLIAYSFLRLAISTCTIVFNAVYTAASQTQSFVQANSSSGSGISALTYFGVVNAFFPVPELFTFLAGIFAIRTTLWVYVLLRGLYKNVPLKAT